MALSLILDPSEVAPNRTPLPLTVDPIQIDPDGIDWGDAAIQTFLADMRTGSLPVDSRLPNRVVSIPLHIYGSAFSQLRRKLQQKVGLIQQEGGWLKRQSDATPLYADVVNATLAIPEKYGEDKQAQMGVTLELECLPDFYGDEITLDALVGAGYVNGKLKASGADAVIQGDYPGRARIDVSDTSGNNQLGLWWALRARYYNALAKVRYVSADFTLVNGSTRTAVTYAEDGYVIRNTGVNDLGWLSLLALPSLPHVGTYRVLCRVVNATPPTRLRFIWSSWPLTGQPNVNDPVDLPGVSEAGGTNFYLVDLGQVQFATSPLGASASFGAVQGLAASGTVTAQIDSIYLIPVSEYAGRLSAIPTAEVDQIEPTRGVGGGWVTKKTPGAEANDASYGTAVWTVGSGATPNRAQVTVPTGSQGSTQYYKATNFGFTLPASATVLGVQIGIKRWVDTTGSQGGNSGGSGIAAVWDDRIRLVKGGIIVTPGRAKGKQWSGTAKWAFYGGPTDLWGQTLLYSDVNLSTFGFVVAAAGLSSAAQTTATIVAVSMTVYYQISSGLVVAQDSVIYANRLVELRTDGVYRQDAAGTYGAYVPNVRGDLPRMPVSGIEQRPVELTVVPSRGDFEDQPDTSPSDALSVVPHYRPCWLFRP